MTKVLVVTNKTDLTADFIIKKLKEKGVDFYRFNTEEITASVSLSLNFDTESYLINDLESNSTFDLNGFTSVYYRRPELPVLNFPDLSGGEVHFLKNEILYTLEGVYKILKDRYWISPLYSIREAENKIYQLILAKSLGFAIPNSLITNVYENCQSFFTENSNSCIIKPIKSGLVEDHKNSKVVFTNKVDEKDLNREQIESCPQFFQKCIAKNGDIRATVVGDKVFATLIHSQEFNETMTDWRKGEMRLKHTKIELPIELEEKCIILLRKLGLKFGAIDFVLDKNNNYTFLEINPNGQWAWIEKQTGYDISGEIVNLLKNENF